MWYIDVNRNFAAEMRRRHQHPLDIHESTHPSKPLCTSTHSRINHQTAIIDVSVVISVIDDMKHTSHWIIGCYYALAVISLRLLIKRRP